MTSQMNQWLLLTAEEPTTCARCCRDSSLVSIETQAVQEAPSDGAQEIESLPAYQEQTPSRVRRRNRTRRRRHNRRRSPSPTPRALSPLQPEDAPGEATYDYTRMRNALPPQYSDIEFEGWNGHQPQEYFPQSGVPQAFENYLDVVAAGGAPQHLLDGRQAHQFIRQGRDLSSSPEPAAGRPFMLQIYLDDMDDYIPGSRYVLPLGSADLAPEAEEYPQPNSFHSMSPTISTESDDFCGY